MAKAVSKSTRQNIALIGCGKMGAALLEGWLASGINAHFTVVEPAALPKNFKSKPGILHKKSVAQAAVQISKSNVIVLAIKPQMMAEVCAALETHIPRKALVLSIAAGQSLKSLASYFVKNQPIVRSMPNTPAAIGKGITVMIANKTASNKQKKLAAKLLGVAGLTEWTKNESLMDAVTAVSGSGPAYVFYMIEALTTAAKKQGLPPALAEKLARQTVIGSAALAEANPKTSAAELRKNVTSPGGTTEAALKVMMDGCIQEVFNDAIKAATKRGRQLNK